MKRGAQGVALAVVAFLCMVQFGRANELPLCAGIVENACAQSGYPNQFYDCRVERFTGTKTIGQDTLTCQLQNCYAVVRIVKSSGAELVLGSGGCEGLCEEGPGTILASGVSPRNASDLGPGCVNDCKVTFEQDGKASCFEVVCFQVTNVTSTGETCGEDDEPAPDLPDEECEDSVGGAVLCFNEEGDNCTTINGQTICTGPNEPSFCQQNPHSALCVAPSRPNGDGPEWDLTSNYNFSNSNSDDDSTSITTINYYINITNPPPDVPPPDPDVDENQTFEGSATVSGCSSFACDPNKVEGGRIMCAQLRVQWQHLCQLDGNSASVNSSCNQPPRCDNVDKSQCAQMAQLHQIACGSLQEWSEPLTCEGHVTCRGGAVTCAAARELRRIRCALEGDDDSGPVAPGDSACAVPPTCEGGAECALLKQQWALACADRVSVSDQGCAAPPACTGDQGTCLSLQLQWMTACNGAGNGDEPCTGPDCPNPIELPDLEEWAARDGFLPTDIPPTQAGVNDVAVETGSGFAGVFEAQGWLGGGACPQFGSVSVLGTSINLDGDGQFCTVLPILRGLLLAFAAFLSARILMGHR